MQYSREEKGMWLEDWRRSGKSAWAYAKGNGLNPQTFVRWAKQGAGQDCVETAMVEIPSPIMPPAQEIVIEKGEVKIRIPLGIGPRELRSIIEGLGAA